jgi:hypothetical protein
MNPTPPKKNAPLWKRLMVTAPLLMIMTMSGCHDWLGNFDTSSNTIQEKITSQDRSELWLMDEETAWEKTRRNLIIFGHCSGPPFPSKVTIVLTPGGGTSGYEFYNDEGSTPHPTSTTQHENGSTTYTFEVNVSPQNGSFDLHMRYSPGHGTHTVTVHNGGESISKSIKVGGDSRNRLAIRERRAATSGVMASQQDYYLWRVHQWILNDETSMDAATCQDWIDFLQSEDFFLAMRFPVYPPPQDDTESYTLPLVLGTPYTPTLTLHAYQQYTTTIPFTAPLDLRAEQHTFLENELPAAPGERWMAMGVITPTAGCDNVPDLPAGNWDFQVDLALDFGGAQEAGWDQVLPLYYCYQGQDAPPFFSSAMARALGGDNLLNPSYQGWDITCIGPQPLRLYDWDFPEQAAVPLEFHNTNFALITATQTISAEHVLWPLGTDPVTVTLEYSSTLGLPWAAYADENGDIPITGPFVVEKVIPPNPQTRLWMIAEVPAGVNGIETLVITATTVTSPTQSVWTSDHVWVGDWIAPPSFDDYSIYLPLTQR